MHQLSIHLDSRIELCDGCIPKLTRLNVKEERLSQRVSVSVSTKNCDIGFAVSSTHVYVNFDVCFLSLEWL